MLIEEQIKIARLIASGTPREVAISEAKVTSTLDRTGAAKVTLTPKEKQQARVEAAKAKREENKKNQKAKKAAKAAVAASNPIETAKSLETISKDEGEASATLKMGKN